MTAADDAPEISVVIPAVHSAASLRRTLDALARQPRPAAIEILVVDRLVPADSQAIAREYPRVRIVPGRDLAIPQMRAAGLARAGAPIAAILGDHLEAAPTWQDAMLRGHDSGAAAVGGPIAYRETSAAGWAAFFLEYAGHMTPLPAGRASGLLGSNVSYSGDAIPRARELYAGGAWETDVHDALARSGVRFRCEPGAEVTLVRGLASPDFAPRRWHLARSHAGIRARTLSPMGRLAAAVAAPFKAPLRALRVVRGVLRRPGRGYAGALVRSSPWLAFYLLVWTAGDAAGYLLGEADSTRRVL